MLKALENGKPVKLPEGCNAVIACAERGGISRILAQDIGSLRGTAWKSVTTGTLEFCGGRPNWKTFKPMRRTIKIGDGKVVSGQETEARI